MSYFPIHSTTPGHAGSNGVGDDNSYTNFTPSSATIKGAISAIDTTFTSITSSLNNLTNSNISASAAIAYSKLALLGGSTNDILTQNSSGYIQVSGILSTNLLLADGTVVMTGALNLGGFTPSNSGTPFNPTDVANKNYVDNSISSITSLPSLTTATNLNTVGTITSGTWNGTTIAIARGGTGQTTASAAFNALSPMTTTGDLEYESGTNTASRLPIGTTGQVLTVVGGIPAWSTAASSGANTALSNLTTTAINQALNLGGNNIAGAGSISSTTLSVGSATQLTVDSAGDISTSGNISGILISAERSNAGGGFISGTATVFQEAITGLSNFGYNVSYNGTNWVYLTSDGGAVVQMEGSTPEFVFYIVPPGTAGATASINGSNAYLSINTDGITIPNGGGVTATGAISGSNLTGSTETSIPGTITWTGTSSPTGVTATYIYTQAGNQVTLYAMITATGAGLAVTSVTFPLPPSMPTPHTWTINTGSSPYQGAGQLSNSTSPDLTASGQAFLSLITSVWTVTIADLTGLAANNAWCTISYTI